MDTTIVQQAAEQLKHLFTTEFTEQLARESGFVRRSTGKLNPFAFLIVMVVELSMVGTHSLSAICEMLTAYGGSALMTAQALSQRLASGQTVRFLKRCYSVVLLEKLSSQISTLRSEGILGRFTNVLIEDSTTVDLHQRVAGAYKGVGGGASRAGMKLHTIWNATSAAIESFIVTKATVPDQAQAHGIVRLLKRGSLILRDLGYFCIPAFKAIHANGSYFVSRLRAGVNVYSADGQKIASLAKHIEKHLGDGSIVAVDVRIGAKDQFPVRLIATRVPQSVHQERLRKRRRQTQNHGHTLAKESKNLAKFVIYITNVPKSMLSAEEIPVLYKLRWDIELVFKTYKSRLQLHILKGQTKARVECFLIARLIAIVAVSLVFTRMSGYVALKYGLELSLNKFTAWALRHEFLMILFYAEGINCDVLLKCDLNILTLCKQERSRKTTRELLAKEATFSDLYPLESQEEMSA